MFHEKYVILYLQYSFVRKFELKRINENEKSKIEQNFRRRNCKEKIDEINIMLCALIEIRLSNIRISIKNFIHIIIRSSFDNIVVVKHSEFKST